MIKSQNGILKLFLIFLVCILTFSFQAFCESAKEKLQLADSLFTQKKYTQSFEIYSDIQKSDQKASPAMLLKMAFIKEGLGDITNALYYLNLYYLTTYDKKALKKMENLAEQNRLAGYDYDDAEFFLNLYHQYHSHIEWMITVLVVMLFALLFYRKRTNLIKSKTPGILYICLLLLLFALNNFARERAKALVISSNTHLMKGPSSGSDVIEVVTKGHRVQILGKNDVWVKVSWNDNEAYIKSNNLLPIKL